MDKNVSHFLNRSPWNFGMCILELFRQFIYGFANYLYIVNYCMKVQLVFLQLLFADSFNIIFNTSNRFKDML